MKQPLDPHPYARDPRSRLFGTDLADGGYVYVQDSQGEMWVLPDGPHIHPRVLGSASPAEYAGDLTVQGGRVIDVTNLSGTFQCDDPDGLLAVADQLISLGAVLIPGAVRFFPMDGSHPVVLK
jgi:hypothetical protein